MIHASLFSGIGGPEVAAAMMGWENAFHCEINPFGRAVLEYWFPNSKSYEDITKTDFREWRGKIDILTGGFPCQPFSYAGKRGGREDERYLWPEMLRVIDEVRPTWVVGENVAGITTMVEGGVLTPMGNDTTLFGEGDGLHRYELRQSFTIERICRDLEGLGYSVQPVLIPAAAVGAPHRRDRVFILAHASDADRRDDVRVAGEHESKGEGEGLSERHSIRKPGVANKLRSEVQGAAQDTLGDGCRLGEDDQQGRVGHVGHVGARDDERVCREKRISASDTNGNRGNEIHEHLQRELADGSEFVGDGWKRDVAHPYGAGLQAAGPELQAAGDRRGREEDVAYTESEQSHGDGLKQSEDGFERKIEFRGRGGKDDYLLPENRWADFPTVSPVHAGNDGLPFRMDGASIPFGKWRTEALKAYGNAILPQVMYRIFQAIQSVEDGNLENNTCF